MRYINKKFWSLSQGVPKETKQGYNKVSIKPTKDNKEKQKNICQSPNKQRDAATIYDNQMDSTHFFVFNHLRDAIWTFSSNCMVVFAVLANSLWFLSFQRTQIPQSQIKCKKNLFKRNHFLNNMFTTTTSTINMFTTSCLYSLNNATIHTWCIYAI